MICDSELRLSSTCRSSNGNSVLKCCGIVLEQFIKLMVRVFVDIVEYMLSI